MHIHVTWISYLFQDLLLIFFFICNAVLATQAVIVDLFIIPVFSKIAKYIPIIWKKNTRQLKDTTIISIKFLIETLPKKKWLMAEQSVGETEAKGNVGES